MKIGVCSLQGDFEKHGRILQALGADFEYVAQGGQLAGIDGLILPGGESTTMLKLLDVENLFEPLLDFARSRPLFGTCAGAILMAREVTAPAQRSLGLMDITVERNAYGRQIDSFIQQIDPSPEFAERTAPGEMETVFIRAPIIRKVEKGVNVLAVVDSSPVLVEQGQHLAATFHPELTGDTRVHQLFLDKIRDGKR